MNNSHRVGAPKPWYREIWPWLLMLPPALSVAGGVTMVVLATRTSSALAVDDYARIETLTKERFARDLQATRLGISAELAFERQSERIVLSLAAVRLATLPQVVTLRLRHATNPARDLDIALVRQGEVFSAPLALPDGLFAIELLPPDRTWRLGAGPLHLDGRVALSPQTDGA
jgi:hypothetical protein